MHYAPKAAGGTREKITRPTPEGGGVGEGRAEQRRN